MTPHAPTLPELGASKSESSCRQQVAMVPPNGRAEYVGETKPAGGRGLNMGGGRDPLLSRGRSTSL